MAYSGGLWVTVEDAEYLGMLVAKRSIARQVPRICNTPVLPFIGTRSSIVAMEPSIRALTYRI